MRDSANVQVIGRLRGIDPPTYTKGGKLVVKCRISVLSQQGSEVVERLVLGTAFGDTAQTVQAAMSKPDQRVIATGVVESRPWTDKSGSVRYSTDFLIFGFGQINTPTETDHPRSSAPAQAAQQQPLIEEEDVPF